MQQEHLMKRSLSSHIFKKTGTRGLLCFCFFKNKILLMLTLPDCCTVEIVCVNVCVFACLCISLRGPNILTIAGRWGLAGWLRF